MPSSDSDDFESADEGSHDGTELQHKKERKKRVSSSNYSDSAQESDQENKKSMLASEKEKPVVPITENIDGWDDFNIDVSEPADHSKSKKDELNSNIVSEGENTYSGSLKLKEEKQDSGWDDFDDWDQDVEATATKQFQVEPSKICSDIPKKDDIKSVADKLSTMSTTEQKSGGSSWGWGGWGVDSLLTSATAGITTLTSHVSQGISTVLETGIGAPDPEELAKRTQTNSEPNTVSKETTEVPEKRLENEEQKHSPSDAAFPFGNIISGVTKFVETTGSKVITGGLDTLETIGKKTMEVLQDGDPGLVKKKAMLGLDSGDKPVLSQLLREAKAKAEEEDRIREEKREAKEVHYETLFDDFEGLVHLEALEMLSKQVNMRIEERLRSASPEKRQEIKETLQQVAELCEMPEEDDDDDLPEEKTNLADTFHERLREATEDLGLKLQFQPLVKHYTEVLDWLGNTNELTEKNIYKKAVSSLAECTASCVEIYHKSAEMLLVKSRRSTADEADALTQMTVVLTKHINDLATHFTEKLNSLAADSKENLNNYITNVFLEAGNSCTYIQNAFHLALPILQIGAA